MTARDYDELKRQLKSAISSGKFSEENEAKFVEFLESELEKVKPKVFILSLRCLHSDTSKVKN